MKASTQKRVQLSGGRSHAFLKNLAGARARWTGCSNQGPEHVCKLGRRCRQCLLTAIGTVSSGYAKPMLLQLWWSALYQRMQETTARRDVDMSSSTLQAGDCSEQPWADCSPSCRGASTVQCTVSAEWKRHPLTFCASARRQCQKTCGRFRSCRNTSSETQENR